MHQVEIATTRESLLDAPEMTLNMGPQHPSTHGVLRVVLKLDGETVIDLDCDIHDLASFAESLCGPQRINLRRRDNDNWKWWSHTRRFDRNEVRDMRRTTLAGNAPTIEQLAA